MKVKVMARIKAALSRPRPARIDDKFRRQRLLETGDRVPGKDIVALERKVKKGRGGRHWTGEEQEVLYSLSHLPTGTAFIKFRSAGYKRTYMAVAVKLTHLRLEQRPHPTPAEMATREAQVAQMAPAVQAVQVAQMPTARRMTSVQGQS